MTALRKKGQPETIIKNAILDYLNLHPQVFVWPNDSVGVYDPTKKTFRKKPKRHVNGVSDILGIAFGRPLAIEVKTQTGRVTEFQKQFLETFETMGGVGFIARSLEDAVREIDKITPMVLNV